MSEPRASRSGHLPANGLSLYHEVYGELGSSGPPPLSLIPGAFMGTGSMASWVRAAGSPCSSRCVTRRSSPSWSRCPRRIEGLDATAFAGTPVETAFREHTPDGSAFDAYVQKMKVLNIEDQDISDAQMRSIPAKAMVIIGDADGVTPQHAVAMFGLLGGGDEEAAATGMLQLAPAARLVILPATSHVGMSGESAVLVPMISAFLDDVPPATPDLFG